MVGFLRARSGTPVISLRAASLRARPSQSPIYFAARLVRDKSRNRPNRLSLFTPSLFQDTHPAVHRWKFSFCQTVVDRCLADCRVRDLACGLPYFHYSYDLELNKDDSFPLSRK